MERFAEHAGVPVWNALTDAWHPTQSLADILTMTEHHGGGVEDIAFCFTGDGTACRRSTTATAPSVPVCTGSSASTAPR